MPRAKQYGHTHVSTGHDLSFCPAVALPRMIKIVQDTDEVYGQKIKSQMTATSRTSPPFYPFFIQVDNKKLKFDIVETFPQYPRALLNYEIDACRFGMPPPEHQRNETRGLTIS